MNHRVEAHLLRERLPRALGDVEPSLERVDFQLELHTRCSQPHTWQSLTESKRINGERQNMYMYMHTVCFCDSTCTRRVLRYVSSTSEPAIFAKLSAAVGVGANEPPACSWCCWWSSSCCSCVGPKWSAELPSPSPREEAEWNCECAGGGCWSCRDAGAGGGPAEVDAEADWWRALVEPRCCSSACARTCPGVLYAETTINRPERFNEGCYCCKDRSVNSQSTVHVLNQVEAGAEDEEEGKR